ncbi:S1C family serine protease [Amycolatopsis sp. NPDC059657]|uniref:S1C family serine protease n=1 Tax=Amycolatopsis sp. NPDC059657 TaxID=3346899 RepID=UPI00366E0C49
MTENDPQNNPVPGEQSGQPVTPAPHDEPSTPPRGNAAVSGEQAYVAPSPWSPQQQPQQAPYQQQYQHAYGQVPQGNTSVYAVPPQQEPKKQGAGKLVAGVAVLALLVGGGAGALGGYLAGGGGTGSSYNALDAPKPAKQTGNAPAGSVESVAQKLSPSVVELQVSGSRGAGEGSGFVLSADGYILTNNHVVEVAANGGQIQAVFRDGKKAVAQIVGRDPTTDIAVVKATGVSNLVPVELGRSDDLAVGQGVVAIGSPFELAGTVTSGIVSSLHRPVQAGGSSGDQTTVMDAVQTDAAINPGNSGGPLANMQGQVIGINSAIYSPRSAGGSGQQGGESGSVGIGFAIPIDQARRTADDIIKTGKAKQTFIGAGVKPAEQGGASIISVEPGSPAEQGGLKVGDVVVKIDDRLIDDADALIAAVRTRAPNEKVKFTTSDQRVLEITLGGKDIEPK